MILWADSFDHYGPANGSTSINLMLDGAWAEMSAQISNSAGGDPARTGTRSLAVSGTNTQARRVFGAAKSVVGVGGAFYWNRLPVFNQGMRFYSFRESGNHPQVTLFLDTTGVMSVWRGTGNAEDGVKLCDSGTDLITPNAWNHVEMMLDFGTNTVEVRLNGVTVASSVGASLINPTSPASGEASAAQVTLGAYSNSTGTNFWVDDLIAWDDQGSLNNDFIGDKKVFTDFPDADTADADWTRSTGSTNFGVIDENPPNGDTDYLTTIITGDKFGVTFPDLPAEVVSVDAVIFVQKTRKTDAGLANVQLLLQSGGFESDGTDRPVTTQYTLYHDVFEVDPATSAPFTRAAASAAALQAERTA